MTISFDLLPTELQASVVELRADGASEAVIQNLITRTLAALATYRNKAQVDIGKIGIDLKEQLTQIGDKLQADLQSQHGATNTMLADLNTAWLAAKPMIEEAGQGIADLKKQWSELNAWRSRVEAALLAVAEFREESTKDRADLRSGQQAMDARHGQQIAELITQFRSFDGRLAAIEQLLEVAGQAEAGR